MDKLSLVVVIICILTIVYFERIKNYYEHLAGYNGPRTHQDGNFIRRWRSAIPQNQHPGIVSRQVADDWWDRSYNSGIGFQLG